jgi:hypothetical protein
MTEIANLVLGKLSEKALFPIVYGLTMVTVSLDMSLVCFTI